MCITTATAQQNLMRETLFGIISIIVDVKHFSRICTVT